MIPAGVELRVFPLPDGPTTIVVSGRVHPILWTEGALAITIHVLSASPG